MRNWRWMRDAGFARFQNDRDGFVIHRINFAFAAAADTGRSSVVPAHQNIVGESGSPNCFKYLTTRCTSSSEAMRRDTLRIACMAAGTAYRLVRAGFLRPFGRESYGCRFCWILGKRCVGCWLDQTCDDIDAGALRSKDQMNTCRTGFFGQGEQSVLRFSCGHHQVSNRQPRR